MWTFLVTIALLIGVLTFAVQLQLARRIARAKTDVPIFNQIFVLCLVFSGWLFSCQPGETVWYLHSLPLTLWHHQEQRQWYRYRSICGSCPLRTKTKRTTNWGRTFALSLLWWALSSLWPHYLSPILLLPCFFDQVRVSVQGVCGSSYFIVGHPSLKQNKCPLI